MSLFKKKPKPTTLKTKSSFEKKKLLGILLIVSALLLTFVVMPLIGKAGEKTAVIAVAKSDIKKGMSINEKDISFVERGIYGVENYITEKDEVIGKLVATDLLKGDTITTNKIGTENISRLDAITSDKKSLTTISVKSNAAGLASHLRPRDLVRIYTVVEDEYSGTMVIQNPLLEKVEVYDIENSATESIENKSKAEATSGTEKVATTITFVMVSKEQEKALLEAEYNGNIHVVFLER